MASDESLDAAWGTPTDVTDNGDGSARHLLKSGKAAIVIGGNPQPEDLCSLPIFRDPTHNDDTYDEMACLIDIRCVIRLVGWSEG